MMIKQRLQSSPFYTEIINESKNFMESLSDDQIKKISKGRNSDLFKSFQSCSHNSFIPANKCVSEMLESHCEEKFRMLSRCMLANVNKDQKLCEDPVQDYAVCLKNVTQKFYLSTVLSF